MHVNHEFYRSTRESAFNLTLTFAQIAMMVSIHEWRRRSMHCQQLNVDKGYQGCLEIIPEFVDEGDGTRPSDLGIHQSTRNCLVDKGLITGFKGNPVFTRAGHLAFQMLQVSGHIQELTKTRARMHEMYPDHVAP